jgi:hypothetical protein
MKKMCSFLIGSLLIGMTSWMVGCSKESAPENPTVNTKEEAIVFSISPDPGVTVFSVIGASQDFTITISSKLPTQGVTAKVTVTRELDGVVVFSQNLSTSFSSFNSSIQNLQNGVLCNASIKLTSKSDSTNSSSKSFKLARK